MSSTPHRELSSIDISRTHSDFLNQPSPYHDNFTPTTPHTTTSPSPSTSSPSPHSNRWNPLSLLSRLRHLRYSPLSSTPTNNPHDPSEPDRSSTSTLRPFNEKISESYTDHPHDRWFTPLFLLLLLSFLLNFFLLFNGPIPPSERIAVRLLRHPHRGYTYQDKKTGGNVTCWRTESVEFKGSDEEGGWEDLGTEGDGKWEGLMGSSRGVVFVSADGKEGKKQKGKVKGKGKEKEGEKPKTHKAQFAMFHQLSCLSSLRTFIQTPTSTVSPHLTHCLHYLHTTLLCHADSTLLPARLINGHWTISTENTTRTCRDPSWMYDVTACGEGGCKGSPFYHDDKAMAGIYDSMDEVKEMQELKEMGMDLELEGV